MRAVLRIEELEPADIVERPFRGLRAFEEEHAHLFFGRRAETKALVERLTRTNLLLVVGDSGSGKSSLVKAGLVPAFRGPIVAAGLRVSAPPRDSIPPGNPFRRRSSAAQAGAARPDGLC